MKGVVLKKYRRPAVGVPNGKAVAWLTLGRPSRGACVDRHIIHRMNALAAEVASPLPRPAPVASRPPPLSLLPSAGPCCAPAVIIATDSKVRLPASWGRRRYTKTVAATSGAVEPLTPVTRSSKCVSFVKAASGATSPLTPVRYL